MQAIRENKKSIVHIIDRLHAGGAERVLTTQANLFVSKGHVVKVITIVSEGPLVSILDKKIIFQCLWRKWKWNPLTMYRLVKAIKDFDIVHVHSSFNLRYLYLATRLFFYPVKIFFQEHSGKINIDKYVSRDKKYIYPKVTVICVSAEIAKWVKEDVGVATENIFVLPNIVLKENIIPEPKPESGKIKLLIVSNFVPSKNIEFALKLMRHLLDTGGEYTLTIIGVKADENYFRVITGLISEMKLEADVDIISDCLRVQPLLQFYDIAIHTTKYESGPLVLVEFIAQGLPFLTFNTGQVVETIRPLLPEFIVNSFEVEEWKTKIQQMLIGGKESIKQRFENIFSNFFSPDAYYQKCIDIYNSRGIKYP